MNPNSINSLKLKGYLKSPAVGGNGTRVELCTDKFGNLFVVKWAKQQIGGEPTPASLVYEYFAIKDEDSYVHHLPFLFSLDDVGSFGRTVTEYCQGHDLEELASYALLSGERIPEAFLWHIISSFTEYCFALSTCHLNLAIFDPAHVLFALDKPNHTNAAENVDLQYPRVVFCGQTDIVELYPEGAPDTPASHVVSCVEAFRGLGRYLLSLVRSIPASIDQSVGYSEALISWLKIIAGADDGPPRYLDLNHMVTMLYSRIEEYRGPAKSLQLTPWLSRYFKQIQLESDTLSSVRRGLNRVDTRTEMEDYIDKFTLWHDIHDQAQLMPMLPSNVATETLLEELGSFFDKLDSKGTMTDQEWALYSWHQPPPPISLEELRARLSKFMHGSLKRSIVLGKWSGIRMGKATNEPKKTLPLTRAIHDGLEPEILQRTVRALAVCQRTIMDRDRRQMMGIVQSNLQEIKYYEDDTTRILRLLGEVAINYQAAFNRAAYDGHRWKLDYREPRSTIKVHNSLLEWEKWFTVYIEGCKLVTEFAKDLNGPGRTRADEFLKLELDIPSKRRIKQILQDKIVSRGDMTREWLEGTNAGQAFDIPDWKYDSEAEDYKKNFDWVQEIRKNATQAAEGMHSPRSMGSADPASPKAKVTDNLEQARNLEAEYQQLTRRPRLPPRSRQDLTKNERRVFKIMKTWRRKFARGEWYTDGNLFENYRQHMRRRSRNFDSIRSSFNRRGQNIGGSFATLGPEVRTRSDGLEHVHWVLNATCEPRQKIEEMDICSSGTDESFPVLERPSLWDVSDSSGTEDARGRWVSKRYHN